jgi:hypothetical protein
MSSGAGRPGRFVDGDGTPKLGVVAIEAPGKPASGHLSVVRAI